MGQRGDTIIEVLLAMSVVGLVLGASFGIANRSVAVGRSARERSEALKIAESQIELIKQYTNDLRRDGEDVYGALNNAASGSDAVCVVENSDSGIRFSGVDASDNSNDCKRGLYSVSVGCADDITDDPNQRYIAAGSGLCSSDRTIAILITWDNALGGDRIDRVELFYRLGQ